MHQTIPSTLAPFFQEYDLTQLRIQQDAKTIIERTLRFGTRSELRWLFSIYSIEHISQVVRKWGRFGLPEPHLSFWKLILDIPTAREAIQNSAWGNLVFVARNVRLGFYGYGYPLVERALKVDDVSLASLTDIGLMKLDTLLSRASRKDFHDLYAICQRTPLRNLLDAVPRKFSHARDFEAQVVKHLVYFERAEQEAPVPLIEKTDWQTVKDFFFQQAREIGSSWLK